MFRHILLVTDGTALSTRVVLNTRVPVLLCR
jgi:hypothetical protein